MSHRVVVLGSGVDALVAAHYLARSGCAVTLFGEKPGLGGEMLEAGWIPQRIVRELDLARDGLEMHAPDPWAMVPLPDGDRLELTSDVAVTAESIRKISPNDAAKWPAFCQRMHTLAHVLEALYASPPPEPLASSLAGKARLFRSALRVRGLGRRGMEDLFRLLPMSAADFLDDWFESDMLKGVLGGAAILHLAQGPRSGGTAFNLLHHHVGSPPGVFRQPLSNMRAALERRTGIDIRSDKVVRIDVRAGRAEGVALESGEELAAAAVVSGLAPARTLLELADPGGFDPQLVRAVRNIRSRGVVAQILLTLDREPRFTTLVIAPSLDYLERAYDEVKYGRISSAPYIEARYTPAAGTDRHLVQLHIQYAPHALKEGVWDTAQSESYARAVIARMSEHVPGFAGWVMDKRVLTPDDLEHIHGFPQGQIYHAELALDQVLWMRPVPQLARYRTPMRGLYLCGPAMHPGGGIMGAAGANAAAIVLRDL